MAGGSEIKASSCFRLNLQIKRTLNFLSRYLGDGKYEEKN